MPHEQPVLSVRDLAVSFGSGSGSRSAAVAGVSMSLFPRQTLAVVGESGCGKSVTAMSLLHLIPSPPSRVDRGEAIYCGRDGVPRDLLKMNQEEIRDVRGNRIAMIFQEPMTSLNPVLTIGEQIIEVVQLHQRVDVNRARAIAIEAMKDVGISSPGERMNAYPHQFSGGMRQRVMIAMALVCQPDVLLADEPTTALDVTIQAQILALLRNLQQKKGMSIMLITHALGVVAENADVVCVMYAGRVVEYGTVLDIFDRPLHPYTRGLLASIPQINSRNERLRTISQMIDEPGAFAPIRTTHHGERTPWWPVSSRRKEMRYTLAEVEPQHWVGVWTDHEHEAIPVCVPECRFRMSENMPLQTKTLT